MACQVVDSKDLAFLNTAIAVSCDECNKMRFDLG
jgi:hypothetical protein